MRSLINTVLTTACACFLLMNTAWANSDQDLKELRAIDLLYDLAIVAYLAKDYPTSMQRFDQLKTLVHARFGENHPENMVLLSGLALVFEATGDMKKAYQLYQQVEEIKLKTKTHEKFKFSIHRVMRIYVITARGSRVKGLLKTIFPKESDNGSQQAVSTAESLVKLFSIMKDVIPAEEPFLAPYKTVSEVLESLSYNKNKYGIDDIHYGYMLFRLGVFQYNYKNYKGAITALEEFRKSNQYFSKDHPYYVVLLHYLAHAYKFSGQTEKGDAIIATIRQHIKTSEFYQRNGFDNPEKPPYLLSFGDSLLQDAQDKIKNTLSIFGSGKDREDFEKYDGTIAENRVKYLKEKFGENNPEYATEAYKLGLKKGKDPNSQREALDYFIESQKFLPVAMLSILAFAPEEERMSYIRNNEMGYHAAMSLVATYFRNDQDMLQKALQLTLNHKGMALDFVAKRNQMIEQNLNDDERGIWNKRRETKQQLVALLLRNSTNEHLKIERLKKDLHEIEVELSLKTRQRKGKNSNQLIDKQITSHDVAKRLKSDVMLVEFVKVLAFDWASATPTGKSDYMAFTLEHKGSIQLIYLSDTTTMDNHIKHGISYLKEGGSDEDNKISMLAASNLYELIWRPLQAATNDATGLIISPEGNLNLVPFAALRSPEKRFLIEDKAILYVTSGRDLLRKKNRKKPESDLALFAHPSYGEPQPLAEDCGGLRSRGLSNRMAPFCELKGTKKEAKAIAKYFKGKKAAIFTEDAATKQTLMTMASPKVLHIATHGFFLQSREDEVQSPEMTLARSGLAFAGANSASTDDGSFNGILTALEVSELDLNATDLVILSACDTGLGDIKDGEGVYGFRRSFVMSGAKNLMMTLWSVDDVATKNMMRFFYKNYNKGEDVSNALRDAQIKFITLSRKESGLAPAYYWAPFIVQGSEGVAAKEPSIIEKGLKSVTDSVKDILTSPFKLFGF